MNKIEFAPQNSIVFIMDSAGGKPPKHSDDGLIHSSNSCVSVGCYPEIDGRTTFILGADQEVGRHLAPVFDGMIATPSRKLAIATVLGEQLLEAEVPQSETRMRVWVNHPKWPSEVVVGWR